MAEIIDLKKHRYKKEIFYIMDQEKWNPLAFMAEETLFLSPRIAREIRHNSDKFNFLIVDDPPKILLYDKKIKKVWVWKSEYILDKKLLENIFEDNFLSNITQIAFDIHEMGWSQNTFDSVDEVIETLSCKKFDTAMDTNPK